MHNMYSSIFNEVFFYWIKNRTKLETIYNSKDESKKNRKLKDKKEILD